MPKTSSSRIFVITSVLIVLTAIAVNANWWSASGFGLFTANNAAHETAATEEIADDQVPDGLSSSDWEGIRAAYEAGRSRSIGSVGQEAYLKPEAVGITQASDQFGNKVAISGDTVVVGAPSEDSSTTGVNSTPDEGSSNSGAAFVFTRTAGVWTQQAYLKPTAIGTTQTNDGFGYSVAVSGDTLVVGARFEDSSTTGVNSTPDESSSNSGAAYIFTRSAGVWTQQAYLKPAAVGTTQAGDEFGWSVAVSGDTVVVGAWQEDSSTTGVNSSPDESSLSSGASYIFTRSAGVWTQEAYLKPAAVGTTQANDIFGDSVAVSGDTVIVGATFENSSTTGVNSTPNESSGNAGAAYVFTRSAGVWTQEAYLKPAAVGTTQSGDDFGTSVAVSGDTVVVGAPFEDSSTMGVNSSPNESSLSSGSAYVFTRNAGVWTQEADLKPAAVGTTQAGDNFGTSVAASDNTLVVGAWLEDSSTTSVNSAPNESSTNSGSAYVFTRSVGVWTQEAYLKPAAVGTTQAGDEFGTSVAVSGDTVVAGAFFEDSSTTGVNSSPNEGASGSGAAYVIAGVGLPTLGDYADTSVSLSGDTTITPSATPANVTSITVSANTNFKGTFAADPTTGIVTVTDAHPAGTYTVTVRAFGPGGTTTKTFTLTVISTPCGAGFTDGFTNAANANAGSQPSSVAIGDFNGDGEQDLAITNAVSSTVSIRLGNGLGGFSGSTNVSVGSDARSIAIGDFNGDGKQDLVVAYFDASSVSIRLGDGLGGFSGSTNVNVGPDARSVAIGDFNGDGRQDLAAANYDSNTVSIRLGDGLGGFSGSTNINVGSNPFSVAIGDFNADGNQDLAVVNHLSATVSIRLGNGSGGFSVFTEVTVGTNPIFVAIGDFNGDGKQDLAVTNYVSNTVSIRLGNGLGGFSGSTNISVGTGPVSVAIGDFDRDGDQDFAAVNSNSDTVSIRLGNGLGGFSSSTSVSVGSGPNSVAIGDFNSDGKQDLAVTNPDSNTVSIRLGSCVATTPTSTNTATNTPTNTATNTATNTPTNTATASATNTPTPSCAQVIENFDGAVPPNYEVAYTGDAPYTKTISGGSVGGDINGNIHQNAFILSNFDVILHDQSGTGRFLYHQTVADLAAPSYAGKVWGTVSPVPVIPNTSYVFSFYLTNRTPGNPAQIEPRINGVAIAPAVSALGFFGSGNPAHKWQQFSFQWTSDGSGTPVDLSLWNLEATGAGNDFGIDTITLVCTPTPTPTLTNTATATATATPTNTPTPTPACKGILDPTFDIDGLVTTDVSLTGTDHAHAVAIQPNDGMIVAAGYSKVGSNYDFALARYDTAGSLDLQFGGNSTGTVTTDVSPLQNDYGRSVAIRPDGKIVVAGDSKSGGYVAFSVARYLSTGSLDGSFNGTGKVITNILTKNDKGKAVAIHSDGVGGYKTVVAGWSKGQGHSGSSFTVVRYLDDGTLDPSFNGTGKVTTPIGNGHDSALAVAVYPDGLGMGGYKIVAAGHSNNGSNYDFALVRYNDSGTLDASFGGGIVTTGFISGQDDFASSVAVQQVGPNSWKTLVAGYSKTGSKPNFALARYLDSGALDNTFDTDGMVTTQISAGYDVAKSVAIQPDGKIVAAGSANTGSATDFALVRYLDNGLLDTTFGILGTGIVTTPILTKQDAAWSMAIQADGNIVAAGNSSDNGSIFEFSLARYTGSCAARSARGSSPTASPTPTEDPTISGTVTYGNELSPPKFVSNAAVTGDGLPFVSTTTDASGQYSLTGFSDDVYSVSLSRPLTHNGISSNDAARVAQHVSGISLLPTPVRNIADVSGNGVISSTDAAKIAQFVVGLPSTPPNLSGTWQFFVAPGPSTFPAGEYPEETSYPLVTESITGQDYVGILFGEVTGNWNAALPRPAQGGEGSVAVELPSVVASTDKEIVVPVNVEGIANKGVISYEFDLRYDPSVMQPLVEPVDVSGTVSRGLSVVTNATKPGLLRVVIYGAYPIDENGVLLNLRFSSVGVVGSVSPISFERIMFNEGDTQVSVANGLVEIVGN
ncbi:MAG: VCBS repeat-containing protein [Chloracidobacterium sp.]|nr:VCBS repeat-containing protein [Chloracidobacterium sp.]